MNKVFKNPYDFWKAGVEISHIYALYEPMKKNEIRQRVEKTISLQTLFICFCVIHLLRQSDL